MEKMANYATIEKIVKELSIYPKNNDPLYLSLILTSWKV